MNFSIFDFITFKDFLNIDVFDDDLILKGLNLIANDLIEGVKNNV